MITRARTAFAAIVALAMLGGASASAAEKPSIFTRTRAIEAKVTIESRLKSYPGLYENLLAESRRVVAQQVKDAAEEYKDDPETFANDRRYEYGRDYTFRSVIGRYVSVVRAEYTNTFGAHPNHWSDIILWDAKAKKQISIRPFFKETAKDGPAMTTLATTIRAMLLDEKEKDGLERESQLDWVSSVKPDILSIGGIALAPSTAAGKSSGLVAHFSPYAVGPYAEGYHKIFVPWTVFKDHLSPEGVALFGGERPKEDEDYDER